MDDGYLIHHNKRVLQLCLERIRKICLRFGIIINDKKTQIIKLSRGFTFLKCRFKLLPDGRVIKKMNPKTITKARRKLKSCKRFIDTGYMSAVDVYQCFQSWRAYARNFNAHRSIENLEQLYTSLFVEREYGYV